MLRSSSRLSGDRSWRITTSGRARPTWSSLRRARGRSTPADHHVITQGGEGAAGIGQTHLPAVPQEPVDTVDGAGPHFRGQHTGLLQVSEPGQERCYVPVAQRGRVCSAVGAPAEVFGQQPDGGDDGPDRAAGQAGQRLGRPHLRGVFEPGLGDRPTGRAVVGGAADEGQPADRAEHP
jgi:hypothetical protein